MKSITIAAITSCCWTCAFYVVPACSTGDGSHPLPRSDSGTATSTGTNQPTSPDGGAASNSGSGGSTSSGGTGGSTSSGGTGGASEDNGTGGSASAATCAQLKTCCDKVQAAEAKGPCQAIANSGNDIACSSLFELYKALCP